ncbi:MAG TPA: hypothetical protein VND64_11390 [Pirellulales bacterium]|nr:hypothetical protein [Pirellulales bacterium]
MAVGITILSGARQGERLEFDAAEFLAGGDSACRVFFDPHVDPGAGGREAFFRLDDEGWSMKNTGNGELLVNDRVVHGSTRLRSGDVVRMSPSGPDFSFNLLARLSAPKEAPALTAPNVPEHGEQTHSAAGTSRTPTVRQLALALVGSAFLVAALLMGLNAWRGGGAVAELPRQDGDGEKSAERIKESGDGAPAKGVVPHSETIADDGAGQNSPDRPQENGDGAPAKRVAPQSKTTDDEDEAATTTPAETQRDAWDLVCDDLRGSVFLLAVEEPKNQTRWPLATGTAIGDVTLLTSATVAVELARFRRRGWKLWAMNQKTGAKIEVVDQRVHAGFESAAGKPDLQIYADLGVVTLAEEPPQVAALATPEDLDDLDQGLPLACVGIAHDGEPLNRFQSYAPEMARGKVFVITSLPPSPGGPRLLHVRMTLPVKVYGAPVVNEAGRVVGVFAESAAPPAGQPGGELNLHYVPIVDLSLVRAWLERRDETLWAPPTVPPETRPADGVEPRIEHR